METLRIERSGALAVLRMDKARANAIDGAFIQDLLEACRLLEADPGIRGVLLASAHPKLFCPGLDLVSLVELERAAMERFMQAFSDAMLALYALPKPVVAAVSGHAIAGGCILALTADLRLLKRGAQIGLNEVKVGVPLPWSVATLLRSQVPASAVTGVALLGRNFSDEAALHAGLAHAVLEAEGFEAACLKQLEEFLDKDARSLSLTKRYLRQIALHEMRARDRESMGEWLDAWFSDETRGRIRAIVAGLGKK